MAEAMKRFIIIFTGCVLIGSSAPPWTQHDLFAIESGRVSSCVACHSNLKKLIRLCWKIEAARPKPLKSSETSGEG